MFKILITFAVIFFILVSMGVRESLKQTDKCESVGGVPMPEGVIRPKAPCAPPKPPLMRVGCNRYTCPLCGSGMKPYLGMLGSLFNVSKGCYQSMCDNYWRNK